MLNTGFFLGAGSVDKKHVKDSGEGWMEGGRGS